VKKNSPAGIIKNGLAYLNLLMLLLSPLAILMFVVGVIVMFDRTATHQGFLRRLEQSGVVTQAVIERVDANWIVVRFADLTDQEPRIGLVNPVYYAPEVLPALKPGVAVSVRYMFPDYESQGVLNEHLTAVQNYWGFLWQPGIMMLIAWVIVVRYPDLLFWGFLDDSGKIWVERGAR
jgi:hypothetical protein